jgi:rfaE bifunctional protein kinase chain/domain
VKKQTNSTQMFPHFQIILDSCSKMSGHKILVLGDIMVDEYIWGDVRRISPEAPVPVVHVNNETMQLGGAANVAQNLRSLGADVELAGVLGSDDLARRVLKALDKLDIHHTGIRHLKKRETIRKTRIIAHSQQVVRVDRETVLPLVSTEEKTLADYCLDRLSEFDALVISDYAKGTLTQTMVQNLIQRCREIGIICAIDPKVKNRDFYHGCSVITPNHHEASLMSGVPLDTKWEDSLENAGNQLLNQLAADAVLVTCGEKGMAIFELNQPMQHIDTVAQSVFDVTGAGDTVISAMTLGLTCGLSYTDSAILANFAAGVVVGKVGTASVTQQEIEKAMRMYAR